MWARAWVRRRLPWDGADGLDSPPTTLPAAPLPAGLGAGIPQALGSSEMALVSASGDRVQGVGAESELNLLDGGAEPCGGGCSPAGQPPGPPWKPHGARKIPEHFSLSSFSPSTCPFQQKVGQGSVVLKEVSRPWLA